ncbi:mannitol dehydrogenase family protein [Thiorhodococcus mannitoliphagus]|uniref:mannitol dehydrogenase family protein n=1 Tax=Thiorhodococcus mannitoliphagus TaxID=329406 RepID=UPI001980832B|nr:mannitol dehydrogenase family protein [Thiorhodococcus mannitoliphagus]
MSPGILHFGVGNFHRAHQALYLDRLFNTGVGHDWAIIGASVMSSDERLRQSLKEQDFLSTVVEQSATESNARVTGAMVDFLMPGNSADIIRSLADPAIRIVSLTITEGGYFINPGSGVFDPRHPVLISDSADPENPKTVFGLMIAGLKERRSAGIPPFSILSCDNIPHNGRVTRDAVVGLARLSDPGLADWIQDKVAFPNSMVDRISPATSTRERELLARDFGIEDAAPVFCEHYSQWVLEDRFTSGRPALETVGVQFVPDVTPYETMKIRMLNGGHATIAYAAGLLGIQYAHEAMEHALLRPFLAKVEHDEIIPIVPPLPTTDLNAYFTLIEERFSNPKIADTVRRLCYDGSNRQSKFITPSINDRLKVGADIQGLALVSALWSRYCFGTLENGQEIEPNDPEWSRLNAVAHLARQDPLAWLAMDDIYGEVGRVPLFQERFSAALLALYAEGVESVLAGYLEGAS